MRKWCNETFYIGFGFQLHFDTKVDFPEKWCQSCTSEWNIIILPVSDWLIIKSKNPKIKTVWSCTITSVDTKSKTTRKTVNESNLQEVLDESMNQLNKLISIPKPYKITSSQNLKKLIINGCLIILDLLAANMIIYQFEEKLKIYMLLVPLQIVIIVL